MQRSVLDDGLTVLEPDFLVDISALAALFTEYGHHPLLYTVNRLLPRANSEAILLGNFAGKALDDIINQQDFSFGRTLKSSFREQVLQFCTCPDFSPTAFKANAERQVSNLQGTVSILFDGEERSRAVLEPSFVCRKLGLQGRVDLMTTDLRLLVEQKSGKLIFGSYRPSHLVQLLLYYGVLRYNFGLQADEVDMRLLYSRYPAQEGLLRVRFDEQLFREAIDLRNRVVEQELAIAREGFGSVWAKLNVETIYGKQKEERDSFFTRVVASKIERLSKVLDDLTPEERNYVEQQLTFVYREQFYSKLGPKEEEGRLTGLIIADKSQSAPDSGYDLLTLKASSPQAVCEGQDFRRGDMVCVYAYEGEPGVQRSLLFRGRLLEIQGDRVVVKLNDGQQNPEVFDHPSPACYALEHDTSDVGTTSAIRSLMAFAAATPQKRQLLLGKREPLRDALQQLSRSYHPDYDDILLRQKQARDYFLLVGPPGTGKTSMALRFIVEEELTAQSSVLLMAYTNRAVDEICAMLTDAGIDFLRLGNEASCDPRFTDHLLDSVVNDSPRLDSIRERIRQTPVVVSTTATMQARPFIFELKRFPLCVVDEASQLLEPDIIGLLANDAIGRFVLIGDYKQLPAVVQQPGRFESLFERLIRQEREQGREAFVGVLRKQGRMHPDVAAFASELFYARERLEPVPLAHQQETSLHDGVASEDELDDVLKERRVLFLNSDTGEAEAAQVADLLRRFWRFYGPRQFDSDKTVGVIVTYRHQIASIRRELERLDIPALLQVSIDTVERYQGSQRDVIIYSFGVEQPEQLDFLTANCFEEDGRVIDRKLNVAMTRARKQLILTGCTAVLQHNPLFATLMERYKL